MKAAPQPKRGRPPSPRWTAVFANLQRRPGRWAKIQVGTTASVENTRALLFQAAKTRDIALQTKITSTRDGTILWARVDAKAPK